MHYAFLYMRMWRNWQTRWIQVPVKAISYGFKSLHPHQKNRQSSTEGCRFFYPRPKGLVCHCAEGAYVIRRNATVWHHGLPCMFLPFGLDYISLLIIRLLAGLFFTSPVILIFTHCCLIMNFDASG